jgi:hypothetical protein
MPGIDPSIPLQDRAAQSPGPMEMQSELMQQQSSNGKRGRWDGTGWGQIQ